MPRSCENRRLIDYFKGRTVWLAERDEFPKRLISYARADQSSEDQMVKARFAKTQLAKAQPVNAQ